MRLITRLGRSISPPYRLNTIILLSTSTVVVMLAGLYSLLAYERLGRETMAAAGCPSTAAPPAPRGPSPAP